MWVGCRGQCLILNELMPFKSNSIPAAILTILTEEIRLTFGNAIDLLSVMHGGKG